MTYQGRKKNPKRQKTKTKNFWKITTMHNKIQYILAQSKKLYVLSVVEVKLACVFKYCWCGILQKPIETHNI